MSKSKKLGLNMDIVPVGEMYDMCCWVDEYGPMRFQYKTREEAFPAQMRLTSIFRSIRDNTGIHPEFSELLNITKTFQVKAVKPDPGNSALPWYFEIVAFEMHPVDENILDQAAEIMNAEHP